MSDSEVASRAEGAKRDRVPWWLVGPLVVFSWWGVLSAPVSFGFGHNDSVFWPPSVVPVWVALVAFALQWFVWPALALILTLRFRKLNVAIAWVYAAFGVVLLASVGLLLAGWGRVFSITPTLPLYAESLGLYALGARAWASVAAVALLAGAFVVWRSVQQAHPADGGTV